MEVSEEKPQKGKGASKKKKTGEEEKKGVNASGKGKKGEKSKDAEDGAQTARKWGPLKGVTENDSAWLKIVSWNVNGLRASLGQVLEYVRQEAPDVLCLQETKVDESNLPAGLPPAGYEAVWNCGTSRKGYAGTAVFSRVRPLQVRLGFGQEEHDAEGRCVSIEFPRFWLVCTYVPNSGQRLERLQYRTGPGGWDEAMLKHLQALQAGGKPVIWTGDLNVAHEEIDLANPKGNRRTAGFTDQERASFSRILREARLVDSFRARYPDRQQFTFWSFRNNAREKNIGWRLDYFALSEALYPQVRDVFVRSEVYGSDHAPLGLLLPRSLLYDDTSPAATK
jgi:exodeoxyribonuclease III